jgi:uncharacterized metal-binding protein
VNNKRVIVIPCSGIGKPLGTVSRQAAYDLVEKIRPEKAATTCLALLVKGDNEAVKLVRENPCIALDGCAKECARKNIELAGGKMASELRVVDVLKELKEFGDYKPETVLEIGESGENLVKEIAARAASEIDRIINEVGEKV